MYAEERNVNRGGIICVYFIGKSYPRFQVTISRIRYFEYENVSRRVKGLIRGRKFAVGELFGYFLFLESNPRFRVTELGTRCFV